MRLTFDEPAETSAVALLAGEPTTNSADDSEGVIVIGNKRYWTMERLAKKLGKSTRTLLRWDTARTGPPRIKIGNLPLYGEEKLPSWLSAYERGPVRPSRRRRSGGGDAQPAA
jgi:hypothetical protein